MQQQKDFERKKAEIREREEKRKWRTEHINVEEGNDGILKNWEMDLLKNGNENAYFNRKKRGMEDRSLIA